MVLNTSVFENVTSFYEYVVVIDGLSEGIISGLLVATLWILMFVTLMASNNKSKDALIGSSIFSVVLSLVLMGTGIMTNGKVFTILIILSAIGIALGIYSGE